MGNKREPTNLKQYGPSGLSQVTTRIAKLSNDPFQAVETTKSVLATVLQFKWNIDDMTFPIFLSTKISYKGNVYVRFP